MPGEFDLIPTDHNPFNDPPTDLIPISHDPFENAHGTGPQGNVAASLGAEDLGQRVGNWWQSQPSWASGMQTDSDQAQQAFAQGGVKGLLAHDPSNAVDLMGGFVGSTAGEVPKGIRAFHGSPHDFDAFDMSKIGTGEGAQAYGHGLYFAGNEGVAKSYRDTLADWKVDGGTPNPSDPSHIAAVTMKAYEGDAGGAIADLTKTATQGPEAERGAAVQAIEMIRNGSPLPKATGGRMYEVNINADPEHFLDWDKPLSKQHQKVQDAVKQAMGIDYYGKADAAKSESLWNDFGSAQASTAVRQGLIASDDALVAKRLNDAGIPGIKYLDQGSRGAGQGTSNYVVFNDKLIDIARKYGLAGLVAGGASHFSTTPVNHDPWQQ